MLINAEGMDAAMTLHTGSSESNASTWRDVTLINNPCTVSSRSSKSSQPESVIVIDVHDHSVTSTIRSYGSSLTSAVAPLVYTMRACGLMHTRHRTCRLSASLCYSLIVMLCLVLNCTRLFWGYYTTERNFRHQLFGRITVHVWTFLSVVGSLMCFMLSKCFPTIARRWNENSPLQESASFKSLRRWSLGGVLLCGFLFIGTAGLAVAYVAGFKNKYQEIASLYFHKKNPSLTFTIFYIFSVLFTEVAWSMSWCAYVIVAMAFKKLFEENHKELQKCIDADGSFIGCIGEIRQRHENICKAVDLADKALSVFTFVVLVTQFTILCYATHNVVRTGLHGISLAVHISVILFCLLHLAALSVIGCKLNKAVCIYIKSASNKKSIMHDSITLT